MRDIDEHDFESVVIQGSRTTPVVVDFWSTRCAPCHVLTPILQSLEAEGAGAWTLVRIEVDRNPQLADDYMVRSIPSVKAFVDGVVVDAFVGAWPRDRLQAWLADVVPGPIDSALRLARAAEKRGELEAATREYQTVIATAPTRWGAHLGLGRIALHLGDYDRAAGHLADVPPSEWPHLHGEPEYIWVQCAANGEPESTTPIFERYHSALVHAADGKLDEALAVLLSIVGEDPDWHDGAAAQAMIRIIAVLGDANPRAATWRSRLGRALY